MESYEIMFPLNMLNLIFAFGRKQVENIPKDFSLTFSSKWQQRTPHIGYFFSLQKISNLEMIF